MDGGADRTGEDDDDGYYDGDIPCDDDGDETMGRGEVPADDQAVPERFENYDSSSGTYLGFDGIRHPCP